jgi:hypothetical protein
MESHWTIPQLWTVISVGSCRRSTTAQSAAKVPCARRDFVHAADNDKKGTAFASASALVPFPLLSSFSLCCLCLSFSSGAVYNLVMDALLLMQPLEPYSYVQPSYAIGWFTLAFINAGVAQGKNRSGLAWFLLSVFLGPLATFILVVLPKG